MMEKASSLDNPSLEVRLIIENTCFLSQAEQIIYPEKEIDKEKEEKAISMLKKRLSGYPMAYLIGKKEFFGHTFKVTPDVLIPRPDTELIVEEAILAAKDMENPAILDLCTGSGAIGTSISYELNLPVALSDISKPALDIAAYNYKNITGKIPDARLGSLFDPWKGEKFDIIVTNPPYLTDIWYENTSIDVKKEPRLALIGHGNDGLDIIREIIEQSPLYLTDRGYLFIEGDYRQMEICAKLLSSKGFKDINILKDLARKDRVVYGRRD